ncbi:MAG: helix-turn-helix transcriptional regulator [Kineosporiaceae bacterium]
MSGEPLWSVYDLASYLGVEVRTVYHWRQRGTGPVALKVGGALRYDPALVREWVAGRVA